MIVLPAVGTVALLATLAAGGAVLDITLFGVAAVLFVVCSFGDQNRYVFFGRRWSMRGEPELSAAGHEAARLGWVGLAVLVVIFAIVDVSPRI
ncbi:hypothetical protein CLV30_103335 [Haloactinopolyspora alba]|uniref:Uncharacterized protein n=1 Tax=Haloactinopolyspora alba TaxID=648780 RepID=A0A2P8E9Q1_9ACTN|nr:hypothetical protein [Haloactinopolyspora alba]PSL06180.1 hypothetical protein CLV30_103335 [Haloactinopolyspora alba]